MRENILRIILRSETQGQLANALSRQGENSICHGGDTGIGYISGVW